MSRASLLLLLLAAALPAAAQVTTCNGSNASLNLGNYDSYQSVPADSSTTLVVTCTRQGGPATTSITIGLGPSLNSGTIATRALKRVGGTDPLSYNIYRDAARALVWGDTPGVNTFTDAISIPNNTSGTLSFTLYGRINALQDVRPGTYIDSLTITVTF